MKYCSVKEINTLVKVLIQQGWSFRWGGKHGKLFSPTGKTTLSVPCTPSDHRAFLNFKRDIRHALNSGGTGNPKPSLFCPSN
jgi:hypothetical protein